MADRDPISGRFLPGNSGFGGRPKGSKNKFHSQFWDDVQADWEAHGASAIATVREKDPSTYLRVCAGLLPKEEEHIHSITGIRLWTETEWLASHISQDSNSEPTTTEHNATPSASVTAAPVKH